MIETIESSYQIYSSGVMSRTWMVIPMFVIAFAIAIPSILELKNIITNEKGRMYMKYLAILFFSYMTITIIVMIDGMSEFKIVEENVYAHVAGLNCEEKLDYIKSILEDRPHYMTEKLEVFIENDFFGTCGSGDF